MFPDIIIGPIVLIVGILWIVHRRGVVEIMHRGLTRMYGEPTADMLASGDRVVAGITVAGCMAIVLGLITIYDALGGPWPTS